MILPLCWRLRTKGHLLEAACRYRYSRRDFTSGHVSKGLSVQASGDTLAYQYINGESSVSDKYSKRSTCVMVHGMLGQGKNLRSFARRIVRKYPFFDVLLVDLRGHGKSPRSFPNAKFNSVENCAVDLYNLFDTLEIEPDVLIGHSFGGKVATAFIKHSIEVGDGVLPRTWVWDSVIGNFDPSVLPKHNSTMQVLEALKCLENPIKSRNLIKHFESYDISPGIMNWMMTNLVVNPAEPGTYLWAFDLECCIELFESYCKTDLSDLFEHLPLVDQFPKPETPILNFVRAGGNLVWNENCLEAMNEACGNAPIGQVAIHDVPDVGHWVHVEAPELVFDLLERNTLTKFV